MIDEMKKNCDICKNEFTAKMSTQKRCSSACRKEYRKQWMFERYGDKSWRKEINCEICNILFFPKMYNVKKCGSKKCRNEYFKLHMRKQAAKKEKVINNVVCIICKNDFTTVGKSRTITCSKECSIKNKKKDAYKRPYRSKPEFKLKHHLRVMINDRIKGKRVRTNSACDYTIEELRDHLESKFKDGMTWDNHSIHGWHIDHIRPLSSFEFFDENGNIIIDVVKEALSLENLQPLWAEENLRKGNKH